MTATDTDALTERIARALVVAMECEGTMIEVPEGDEIWCMTHDDGIENGEWCRYVAHAAAAVLPIVAVEVRKAKAEALREAKGRVYASSWWADGSDNYADRVRGFLSTLATEYETGDSDEHR